MYHDRSQQITEELLTPDELCKKLKVGKPWIYRQTRATAIPRVKCGKYLRFRLSDVLNFLEK